MDFRLLFKLGRLWPFRYWGFEIQYLWSRARVLGWRFWQEMGMR